MQQSVTPLHPYMQCETHQIKQPTSFSNTLKLDEIVISSELVQTLRDEKANILQELRDRSQSSQQISNEDLKKNMTLQLLESQVENFAKISKVEIQQKLISDSAQNSSKSSLHNEQNNQKNASTMICRSEPKTQLHSPIQDVSRNLEIAQIQQSDLQVKVLKRQFFQSILNEIGLNARRVILRNQYGQNSVVNVREDGVIMDDKQFDAEIQKTINLRGKQIQQLVSQKINIQNELTSKKNQVVPDIQETCTSPQPISIYVNTPLRQLDQQPSYQTLRNEIDTSPILERSRMSQISTSQLNDPQSLKKHEPTQLYYGLQDPIFERKQQSQRVVTIQNIKKLAQSKTKNKQSLHVYSTTNKLLPQIRNLHKKAKSLQDLLKRDESRVEESQFTFESAQLLKQNSEMKDFAYGLNDLNQRYETTTENYKQNIYPKQQIIPYTTSGKLEIISQKASNKLKIKAENSINEKSTVSSRFGLSKFSIRKGNAGTGISEYCHKTNGIIVI